MSTLIAGPVAVDLPRILTSEGPSSSRPDSRSGTALNTREIHSVGERPTELPGPPRYPAPPGPQHGPPPSHPSRPGFALPPGPAETGPYYPPAGAGIPPVHPDHAYAPYGFSSSLKRAPPDEPHPYEPPPKKQSKWTEEEDDQLITLRGEGMKWEEIAKHVPGRSAIACRLHYQNFLERRAAWDEEKKNKLAQLYNRLKGEIWDKIARELHMPWRAVEEMHWRMGRGELAQRAGVREFVATPDPSSAGVPPVTGVPITTSFVPSNTYQPPPQVSYGSPTLAPPVPRSVGQGSPLPPPSLPPIAQQSLPPHGTPQPAPSFIDANRPPPTFTAGNRSPTHHSYHSASSHTSSPNNQGHRPRRSGSDVGSPRRRALSSTRLASASMPPLEARPQPTPPPPPPLPPLPREIPGPTSDPGQGMQLPPVRLLQEEVKESSRLGTPTHSGPSNSGSGPSRPHSTTSGSRAAGDHRPEGNGNGR